MPKKVIAKVEPKAQAPVVSKRAQQHKIYRGKKQLELKK